MIRWNQVVGLNPLNILWTSNQMITGMCPVLRGELTLNHHYMFVLHKPWPNMCSVCSYPPDCALRQYLNLFQEAVARTRKPLDVAEKLKDNLISAGFIGVSKEVKKLIWSPWSTDETMKELGRYALLNHETSLEASGLALFTRGARIEERWDNWYIRGRGTEKWGNTRL